MRPMLVAACLFFALPAHAETLLRLSESAQIAVHPDRLSAGLRFEADGATPAEVQTKVNSAMAAALAQAKATAGVSASTGGYNVWQTQATAQAPKRWRAAQGLDIFGSDGAVVLTLVGTLQGQGLTVQQLGWQLAPETARRAHAAALQMALKSVRGRADEAAAALGLTFVLFKTVNLDPNGISPRMLTMAAPMARAVMAAPVAEAADITVEARIEAEAILDKKP